MSIAEHQAVAAHEDATAQQEVAARETTTCAPLTSTGASTQTGIACWTSRSNPTKAEKEDIAKHRELAAEHRAAAAALGSAEAQSCAGIDDEDRDISLFFHRDDIVSVQPAFGTGAPYFGNDAHDKTIGAVIVFHAVPGLTVEWLQHLINCQMARAAALGYEVPEMADSPLVLKNVKATAYAEGDKFRVEVTSDERATIEEILRRARALVPESQPARTAPPTRALSVPDAAVH